MKPLIKWRHQYDQDADAREGELAALTCDDPSLTQQSFREDADLNVIAKRFGLEEIPSTPLDPRFFRDTTQDPELRDILELQRAARDSFLSLPAKLRKRFHNSPEELWTFINDPENAEEAVRLGLLARAGTGNPSPTTSTGTGSPPTPADANGAGTSSTPPRKPPEGGTDTFPKGVT